jgi:hypothetical protein
MRLSLTICALLAAALAGCATQKPEGGGATKPKPASKATVVPERVLAGKVVHVNPVGRFAIVNFPIGMMPEPAQRLFVYRGQTQVGTLKVNGPRRDDIAVADLMEGDCRVGDEVRDR